MTSLFRSRQRADELAALLDAAPEPATAAAGASREARELLGVARALRSWAAHVDGTGASTPREAFVADLRERLLAEAATVLTPTTAALTLPPRRHRAGERRLAAAAAVAVVLGGTAGVATAAQSALPGDALYPVKRGMEQVEVTLSTSDAGRGRDLLEQAAARLSEVDTLLGEDAGAPKVPGTLDAFSEQARAGADRLLASYRSSGDPATVAEVRTFAARELGVLAGLSESAPSTAQPSLQRAVETLRTLDAEAVRLCDTCSDRPALRVPASLVAASDVRRALTRAAGRPLDNSHPVEVPRDAARPRRTTTGGGTTGGQATPSAPGAPSGTVPAPQPPSAPLPSTGPLPTDPPKVKVEVGKDGVKVDPGLGDLGDGLGGVVGTLLPDPTGGSGSSGTGTGSGTRSGTGSGTGTGGLGGLLP